MDQADEELRETINMIWPFQAKKMLDLLIPRTERLNKSNLTVGKVYAGLLILESWRNTRFGQIESGIPVSCICIFLFLRIQIHTIYSKKLIRRKRRKRKYFEYHFCC